MQRTEVDLPVTLDRSDPRPLPVQLADGVRDLIDRGVLRPGERIPASRPLAIRWRVSRGTVVAAMDQLIAEGYLTGLAGSGTVVNPGLARAHPSRATPGHPRAAGRSRRTSGPRHPVSETDAPKGPVVDLRPGHAGGVGSTDPRWRAAWRRAAAVLEPTAPPPVGVAELRDELASHLRRMRGVLADPADLLVTTGARDGLGLVLEALASRLGRQLVVAVEDPGYPSLRRVPARLGARLVEVPVDDDGMDVAALRRLRRGPDVVIVTPSHQYPLGTSMSAPRRRELLAWAREGEALVVEDDFDSELRYVGAPLPALAALDRQDVPAGSCVLTLGSFARTVSGDLGAGFLYLPSRMVGEVAGVRADLGGLPSGVLQRALADYLASGGLRRHIEAMRRDHRRRRARLAAALAELDGATAVAMDGGLHAVVHLTDRGRAGAASRETEVVENAAAQGIRVVALSRYWAHARPSLRHGIVVGHPPLDSPGEAALATLRTVINRT